MCGLVAVDVAEAIGAALGRAVVSTDRHADDTYPAEVQKPGHPGRPAMDPVDLCRQGPPEHLSHLLDVAIHGGQVALGIGALVADHHRLLALDAMRIRKPGQAVEGRGAAHVGQSQPEVGQRPIGSPHERYRIRGMCRPEEDRDHRQERPAHRRQTARTANDPPEARADGQNRRGVSQEHQRHQRQEMGVDDPGEKLIGRHGVAGQPRQPDDDPAVRCRLCFSIMEAPAVPRSSRLCSSITKPGMRNA